MNLLNSRDIHGSGFWETILIVGTVGQWPGYIALHLLGFDPGLDWGSYLGAAPFSLAFWRTWARIARWRGWDDGIDAPLPGQREDRIP